ncbi:hypothetical protein [Streptomyces beihaiensis]|uniref:Uncharacterized protein n=1 Tax=Streptomyces beihaiensis TaxID=2984495 RepID=A0ABT3U0F9_9ACTN|nr:hypothetical protein [Streptomyces beihaiensis]MCX3062798.1 hypothetical protein [Streptomyces beihaiensis]
MTRPRGRMSRGQLLLFVALLLGIVGMHTLGHPTDRSPGALALPAAHSAPALVPAVAPAVVAAAVRDDAPVVTRPAAHAPAAPEHGSTDPMSVCLAVLGSFALLLLTAALASRTALPAAVRPRRRGLVHAQRPNPPPPRTSLSLLSVLRV